MGGEKDVRSEINLIKSALLKKDGLVDPDKQDQLRSQISTAFSDDILDKLSEGFSDTKSAKAPRDNSIVTSNFSMELFSTNQGEE